MPAALVLGASGKKAREIDLLGAVFEAEVKPHLVHETVRAEMADARAATRGGKSRGMVAGGGAKPWRQKGTGRARQGTTRAPQWRGGGIAFPPTGRNFELKVNRKARKAAMRSAFSHHAGRGSLAVLDASAFDGKPKTKTAAELVGAWGSDPPLLVLVQPGEDGIARSFRNLRRTLVLETPELEVGAVVWARSILVTEAALARVEELAS